MGLFPGTYQVRVDGRSPHIDAQNNSERSLAKSDKCCWFGRKSACAVHKRHNFTVSAKHDPLVHELPLQSPNRRKLNERIMSIAEAFVAATNLSCRQAASPAMHDFIVKLMQLGASLPREELRRVVDIGRFVDTISDRSMAEVVR
jgi:hypothetical protein